LTALQAERNNVEELENALELEKQNNTAIAEMVASRDSLIDELNDRVAVFEEDKVVLKAALRQLQKEMKEEAPKTQKIVSELKAANARKFATSFLVYYTCIQSVAYLYFCANNFLILRNRNQSS
jgi:uncharacterized coiled-coil protein SlyX